MPAYDRAVIQGHLIAADGAGTNDAKGRALEDLTCYLFGLIPGVSITERNALIDPKSRVMCRPSRNSYGISYTGVGNLTQAQ
jgi:hypothetical protein